MEIWILESKGTLIETFATKRHYFNVEKIKDFKIKWQKYSNILNQNGKSWMTQK